MKINKVVIKRTFSFKEGLQVEIEPFYFKLHAA